MRAETQSTIEAIRKTLALLAQRMDWETAKHRLEEFDAMIEDPNLWNDPERAQKLMRERQQLIDALGTYESITRDLNDNVELIELGEMEGDTRDPEVEIRLEIMSRDEPGVLKPLAAFLAQKGLGVRAHHGRHAGDNMYLAEFTLTPKARRFEDYPEYVRELRERGFEVRRLEMSVRPDEIAGGPGDTIPMDFPGG